MRSFILILSALFVVSCGDDAPPAGMLDAAVDAVDAQADVPADPDAAVLDAAADSCTPMCEGRTCGDDGCGGTCGECAGTCTDEGICNVDGVMCPPSGPFGTEVGDIAADAMLEDCDGNPVSLHSLCGNGASWLYRFSEWCPPCQSFANDDAAGLFERYADDDVAGVLVIAQDTDAQVADRDDCARLRDRFDLPFPVLIDPRGELTGALGISVNAEAVVFGSGMEILYSEKYNHDGIPAAVDTELAR